MKQLIPVLIAALSPMVSDGVVVAFDSFDQEDYLIDVDNSGFFRGVTSDKFTSRIFTGPHRGDWTAGFDASAGTVGFTMAEIEPTSRGNRVSLRYSTAGIISSYADFRGSGFQLTFTALTGAGWLDIVAVGSSNSSEVVPVRLDSAGELFVPLEYLGTDTLIGSTTLNFSIRPDAAPFAFTLSDISVVPEPAGVSLLALGFLPMVWRRSLRRSNGT